MKLKNITYTLLIAILLLATFTGCQEDIKVGTLSVDMKYFDKKQETTVGFSGEFGSFYFSKSSLPIEFSIENVTEEGGGSIKELSDMVRISIYDQIVVSGDSDAAKEMKNDSIDVPAVEIDKYTGELIVHNNNKVLPGTYHFNVGLSNVSGFKVLEDALILKMNAFTMPWFSTDLGGKPEINYLGASPEQIVFKIYRYNIETKVFDMLSTVDHFFIKRSDFEGNDHSYILEDTHHAGETWQVQFPISFDGSFYDIEDGSYKDKGGAEIDFGQPGNYEVKIFVK